MREFGGKRSGRSFVLGMASLGMLAGPLQAQTPTHVPLAGSPSIKLGGSPNVELVAHLSEWEYFEVGGIDLDEDPSRPYVYLHTWKGESGFDVIDVSDPRAPEVIHSWRFERRDEYEIGRGENIEHFVRNGRSYLVVPHETNDEGGVDADLCAVVFDVTDLPDGSKVREVARIREPDTVRGCIFIFPYVHSSGKLYLFLAPDGVAEGAMPHIKIYDADELLAGAERWGYVGEVPVPLEELPLRPEAVQRQHYHDFFVQYDVESGRDVIYAAGPGGFHIYDVTRPSSPEWLGSLGEGTLFGHTVVATPDSRYALTTNEMQHMPLRIWDIRPLLDGETTWIRGRPGWLGSWIPDWRDVPHNMEVRWPYVFVASYEDGLQVFEMRDPAHPVTVGWYYTCQCKHLSGFVSDEELSGPSVSNGALDLDVRNRDGLIAVSDVATGVWLFRLNGFDGWKGSDYRVPNLSSVQHWEEGPATGSGRR